MGVLCGCAVSATGNRSYEPFTKGRQKGIRSLAFPIFYQAEC